MPDHEDILAPVLAALDRLAGLLDHIDSEIVLLRTRGRKAEADEMEMRLANSMSIFRGGGEP